MTKHIGIEQGLDSDDLTICLNDDRQIIIEHDCDEYHTPYVLIDVDTWEQVKSAIDKLVGEV